MGFKHRFKAFKNMDFKYAFLELVLIIAGILIAFWIDTWWENRQDLKRERSYLSALRTELQDNLSGYESHLKKLNANIATTNSFISLIGSNPEEDVFADSVLAYFWSLKKVDVNIPRRAALDDLLNSGGMQYIRSDILRREIASYEQSFQNNLDKQYSAVNQWDNSIASFGLTHLNFTQIIPSEGIKGINDEERINIPKIRYATDFSVFRQREFINLLVHRILVINELRKSHQSVINKINSLIFLIETQLDPDRLSRTISE